MGHKSNDGSGTEKKGNEAPFGKEGTLDMKPCLSIRINKICLLTKVNRKQGVMILLNSIFKVSMRKHSPQIVGK